MLNTFSPLQYKN